jgi:hypothetical protein
MNKRRIGVGIAILWIAAIAWAQVDLPNTFTDGEVISASEMNANFDALETAFAMLAPKVFYVVPDIADWSNMTSSSTYVPVSGLSQSIILNRAATIIVMINGAGRVSNTGLSVSPFVNDTKIEPTGFGDGITQAAQFESITAIGVVTLGAGTHTVDARFRHMSGAGNADFNAGAMIVLVFPQ